MSVDMGMRARILMVVIVRMRILMVNHYCPLTNSYRRIDEYPNCTFCEPLGLNYREPEFLAKADTASTARAVRTTHHPANLACSGIVLSP